MTVIMIIFGYFYAVNTVHCWWQFAICFTLQEGKRKFDKETTKYSQSLDRYLNMKQNKSNETQLLEVWQSERSTFLWLTMFQLAY